MNKPPHHRRRFDRIKIFETMIICWNHPTNLGELSHVH
jgi:hypothetical protein